MRGRRGKRLNQTDIRKAHALIAPLLQTFISKLQIHGLRKDRCDTENCIERLKERTFFLEPASDFVAMA
jgi:hypothetical protein